VNFVSLIFGSDVMSFDWNLTEKNAGLRWTFGWEHFGWAWPIR
jgi:hypothetical protein